MAGHWSIDIIRQGGFDLWTWVCIAATAVLASYALLGRLWTTSRGWTSLFLIGIGVLGTVAVVGLPPLHSPYVGLVWTFTLLSILSATFYLNLCESLGTLRTATLLAMRIAALALLVPMLFEPVLRYVSQPKPERPLIFLIDTSGSMSFPDVQNGPTRIQSVWQALRPQLARIDEHFVPSYLTFSTGVEELKKPGDLATTIADGKATDLVTGLTQALAKSSRSDASVILISDGIDNTSPDVLAAVRDSQRPIHTVTVGSDLAEPASMANVAVDNVDAADDFVVSHETKVKALIKSTALNNRVVEVKLAEIDSNGKTIGDVSKQSLVLSSVAEGQTVELPYKATAVGVHRIAVWIDPIPGERSTIDNRQEFQGLALDPRIKVLYIEGRVRPEYRELNRALGRDTNVEVASLLRIQKDRFSASGTVEGEPVKTLPTTADEWKKFDVVIIGDLDASFLSKPQQAAIEHRVTDGGGLLMIGGTSTLGPGGYKGTSLEMAIPVFVGELNAAQEKSEFVPQFTSEGLGHPIMEGLTDWFAPPGGKAAKELPPLRGNVVVAGAKNGAQILLVHPQRPGLDGKDQVVLAVQRYGQGRSAVFTGDTTYLWYLPLRGMGQDSPYNRFWGQLVRWLAGEDVRNRQQGAGIVGLLNKSVYQFGETVRVRALVRDERGDATRYAQVTMTINGPCIPAPTQQPLKPSEGHTGMYESQIENLGKGDYTIDLAAQKDGKDLGKQQLKFTVIPPADEMLKLAANPTLMNQIAQATKGFGCQLSEFPALIDQLIRADPAPVGAQERSIPLDNSVRVILAMVGSDLRWRAKYDLPMQGFLVIALLGGEWILRRKWQLP